MRQSRLSGSVEGVMGNHDSYSDCERQFDIPLRAGSNLQNRHPGKEISRWCYVINLARAQSRASLLFRSSKSLNSVEGRQPCCSV